MTEADLATIERRNRRLKAACYALIVLQGTIVAFLPRWLA